MRYWWVSQNQTFEHEISGGYLWSPKTKSNKTINHYYETMREVSRGDLIFSFCDKKIMAIGFALGSAYTCPKPIEFGAAGGYWNQVGWRVDVTYHRFSNPIRPRDQMKILGPLLPTKYSPLQSGGSGNQIYLAEVSKQFGQALIDLIGMEAIYFLSHRAIIVSKSDEVVGSSSESPEILKQWEDVQTNAIEHDTGLTETEKDQVIKSRRGQGLFRNRVSEIENKCRVTLVDKPEHLIASHIKPWKVSNNKERVDGANGLLLTPSIDHLFDHGCISFRDNGALLVSPTAHRPTLIKMGIPRNEDFNVGKFSMTQAKYLEYHRDSIFLMARK